MLTYSINIGTITESSNLGDINFSLNELPDNTSQLITPRDVRDSILTNWANITFKPTSISASNIGYIGIDGDISGIGLKEITFFGKRNLLGSTTMNDSLLNLSSNSGNYTDFYFFNNKSDTSTIQDTRISILAGASSSLYNYAPYVESVYVIGTQSSYLDMNLNNPLGNINLISQTQTVSINGLLFPTILQSASASNGDVLRYNNGSLVWYPLGTFNIDSIISSGTVSIIGNPVLVNGYSIDLTNSNPVPLTIGGILSGSTFSNEPLSEVLTNLLYPYIGPESSIVLYSTLSGSSSNIFVENNSISTLSYIYNLTTGTYPFSVTQNPDGYISGPIPSPSSLSGYVNITSPSTSYGFTLSVTDGTQSSTATASLTYVYPYFYGVTSSMIDFTQPGVLSLLTKIILPKEDVTVNLVGDNSYIYFLYPSSYGNLSSIIDNSITGWNYISSYNQIYSGISLTSSSPNWSSIYNVYSYSSGNGTTNVNGKWTFKF